jgi:hypothetical protein
MRKCSVCHELKDESEFQKSSKSASGLQSQCKSCRHQYYLENKVQICAKSQKFRSEHPRIVKKRKAAQYQKHKVKIRAKHKEYINKPEVKVRKQQLDKIYRQKHKRKMSKYFREKHLLKKYNLTLADYNELYLNQNGKCAICGREQSKLNVDHDHTTGKVRALLCQECNLGLGCLQDCSQLCIKAGKYLKKYGK